MSKAKVLLEKLTLGDLKTQAELVLRDLKALAIQNYPDLAKNYQLKKLKLIYTDHSPDGRAGQAWRSSNTIELDTVYLEKNPEEMLGQILGHEFCHILAPLVHGDKGDGHTAQWKSVMRNMGFRPETYHTMER